jgi:heptosyltransferase-2
MHAKAYVFGPAEGSYATGSGVIAGSSNLTRAGVTHNLELNLGRFDDDVAEQARVWFARIWDEAVPFRGVLLTRRARPDRAWRRRHQADYYRQLAERLGLSPGDELPRIRPGEASQSRADSLLGTSAGRRLVGIAPGAAYGEAKQWPTHRMAALAARLIAEHDVSVVVVGAAHDREAARAIESWLRLHAPDAAARLIDLTGRTSVGALIGLIARMTAFISNDSGAMHVAAAVGRPVVAVFGPTDERRTRPLGDAAVISAPVFCRPCLLRECPIDHRCMTRVTVEAVYDAVAARLREDPLA